MDEANIRRSADPRIDTETQATKLSTHTKATSQRLAENKDSIIKTVNQKNHHLESLKALDFSPLHR